VSESDLPRDSWEARTASLTLMEGRRHATDQAMWHAPAILVAGQAFLLTVLSDAELDWWARLVVLVAGALASLAAAASLLRLRSREVRYSTAISDMCRKWSIPDPRPDALPDDETTRPGFLAAVDGWLRSWAGHWRVPVYWLWIVALTAFFVADIVVLLATL
jgi:hypothetical protein